MIKNYKIIKDSEWDGRIDSNDDFDSFRWHQWIEPLNLNDEKLEGFKGKLGFAFLGFESDLGIQLNKGRKGAVNGPKSIRKEMANLPCQFSQELKLYDAGNIITENISLEEAQESLAQAVDKILELNLFPILLGGGHEIAFGHYMGILSNLEKRKEEKNIGIINFDAHFDLRPYDNEATSGTMFRQIADVARDRDINYSYLCLGIQKSSNTVSLFKTAEELGAKYILAKDITKNDSYSNIEKIDDFIEGQDHLYITVCSDVFSSAFAPGVSAPQALGIDPDKALILLKHILRSRKAISFDIAEVSPRFDMDDTTANLASIIIFALIDTLYKIYLK